MKIVILDGYTLNPGDLDWSRLQRLGEVRIYERTAVEEILTRAENAEVIFTNKTVLSGETLSQLPRLRYIGVLATGYDVVDVKAAGKRNISVTNVPNYGAGSVAQMCFAHILNITNRVADHCRDVANGGWAGQNDFCYWLYPQVELAGKILGIIGYGEIGKAVANLAMAFDMKVLIATRTPPPHLPKGSEVTGISQLLHSSDIISLHCPLTEQTRKLIGRETLQMMKKEAILINTSRGALIDEQALADALNSGRIAAAGLDVLAIEPARPDNPLLTARNCHISPHIAWATREARSRLLDLAIDNLQAFLQGKSQNVVV